MKPPAVIMISGYGRDEMLARAEQCAVTVKAVLAKPVTAFSLLEAIGDALDKGYVAAARLSDKLENNAEAMAKLAGARILLVEDNEMNPEIAIELLNQAGIEVVLAINGQEAIDTLAHDSMFDGVLMDCQMPVMDGYSATRQLRKNPAFQNLPIIAMTANAMAGDREKVLTCGMWDHIAKPLDVAEMFGTIAKWITPRNAEDSVAAAATAKTKIEINTDERETIGLPPLPGIDVTAGLATTMNNEKFYRRMLVKFHDSMGDFAALFAAARFDKDPNAAERAAHTLKGTSGNIGARAVAAAAAKLELACKENADDAEIEAQLALTISELQPVIAAIGQLIPSQGDAAVSSVPAISDDEIKTSLAKLRALLGDSDADSESVLGQLLEKLGGCPLALELKPVELAMAGFDFDTAIEALDKVQTQ
ncbi:MAG: response regulator [Nitrospirae bacterium]|nr:response regulator [Nitrospirota bacterium]